MRKKRFLLLCAINLTLLTISAQRRFDKESFKCNFVDLFIGTAGDNGQVDPAACLPYGMVRVCPDMEPRSHAGYDYTIDKISGFTVNRISGIGCGGAGGNLRIIPGRKEAKPEIIKSTEYATPGYYTVTLNNGVKAELTATNNIALERFHYPEEKERIITLDVTAGFEQVKGYELSIVSSQEIEGFIESGNACNHGKYKLYYNLTCNKPFKVISRTNEVAELQFPNDDKRPVEIRISLSPIDAYSAQMEKERYMGTPFHRIRRRAARVWNKTLSVIDIKGASDEDKKLFYTSLYRVFLSPANVTSHENRFLATNGSKQRADNFTYYSSWSMGNSYRTKFPLIALLDPEAMKDIAISLCKLYKYGKQDWATNYESTPTVRTKHAIAVILDAYRKGLDINMEEAYQGFLKDMGTLQTKGPDQALETYIDYWSMGEIAKELGKAEDAKKYNKMAESLFLSTREREFMKVDESEDDGTKCAYYVFGVIGLYPLIVGEPWYEITSPLYNEATIRLPDNKLLTILAQNRKSPDDPIRQVFFNENEIKNFRINHNELIQGGILRIEY